MAIFNAMKYPYSYLVSIQFLGFRFHGWQKQTNAMSLHEMIDKTLGFVLENKTFKSIGMGRTDSKVSASNYYFQLFLSDCIDEEFFLESFNKNSPQDLKAIEVSRVSTDFNIIQSDKVKEYHYYFSFGEKNHPYAAPFMVGFKEQLDIHQMKLGAQLFEGEHYFGQYCTKPSEDTILKRTIDSCKIVENDILKANFFPKESYVLKVRSKGFLRYQIRLMMGTLVELGKGNISLNEIENSLIESNKAKPLKNIAPSSGLHLYKTDLIANN